MSKFTIFVHLINVSHEMSLATLILKLEILKFNN